MKLTVINEFLTNAAYGACYFYNIADTYCEISSQFLMPNLNNLNSVMSQASDRAQDKLLAEAKSYEKKLAMLSEGRSSEYEGHLKSIRKAINTIHYKQEEILDKAI